MSWPPSSCDPASQHGYPHSLHSIHNGLPSAPPAHQAHLCLRILELADPSNSCPPDLHVVDSSESLSHPASGLACPPYFMSSHLFNLSPIILYQLTCFNFSRHLGIFEILLFICLLTYNCLFPTKNISSRRRETLYVLFSAISQHPEKCSVLGRHLINSC